MIARLLRWAMRVRWEPCCAHSYGDDRPCWVAVPWHWFGPDFDGAVAVPGDFCPGFPISELRLSDPPPERAST